MEPTWLIIGYGNELRSDDAIGPIVAKEISKTHLPHIRTISLHQLTPEVAAELTTVSYAILIDASKTHQYLTIELLSSNQYDTYKLGHLLTPQNLLNLTNQLYGFVPKTWLISVPAINFDLGFDLSDLAVSGIEQALIAINHLINNNVTESKRLETQHYCS